MRKLLLATLLVIGAVAGCKGHPGDVAADNTGKNARDRSAVPTADNAVKGSGDLDITKSIRSAVMSDGTLSTNAHNCKIVVQDGRVTLVGPVASADERATVERIAAAVVGADHVVDQLQVSN